MNAKIKKFTEQDLDDAFREIGGLTLDSIDSYYKLKTAVGEIQSVLSELIDYQATVKEVQQFQNIATQIDTLNQQMGSVLVNALNTLIGMGY